MSADTQEHDDREESDIALVRRATAVLMEHFETVQVFATRHVNDDVGTTAVQWGSGNWFARRGQIAEWLVKQDAKSSRE